MATIGNEEVRKLLSLRNAKNPPFEQKFTSKIRLADWLKLTLGQIFSRSTGKRGTLNTCAYICNEKLNRVGW